MNFRLYFPHSSSNLGEVQCSWLPTELLQICGFHDNRHREGQTFLTSVSDTTFTCVPWHRVYNLQSCSSTHCKGLLCDTSYRINVKAICTTAPWYFWVPSKHFSLLVTVLFNVWLEDTVLEATILFDICDFPLKILLSSLAFNTEQYNTLKHGDNISTGSAKCQNHINMERCISRESFL